MVNVWLPAYRSAMQSPHEPWTMAHEPRGFEGESLRQVVRVRGAGERLRLRLSNLYGTTPLVVGSVAADGAVVTFGGDGRVVVAVGEEAVSDPFGFGLDGEADLAVDLHFPEKTGAATYHPFALRDEVESGFYLGGVDVEGEPRPVVAAFGDSVTDGVGTTPGADRRYPDVLARLAPGVAVANLGLGGNRLLTDVFGERGVARFDRDVLALPGVTHVVVQIGLNDLGMPLLFDLQEVAVEQLADGYRALAGRAAEHGLVAVVATVTPFGGAQPPGVDIGGVLDRRRRLNDWLRSNEAGFAAVADLDLALRDPREPDALSPEYDSGDHLHPSDAGAEVIARVVLEALGL